MKTLHLLYQKEYALNDYIHIYIPTMREVLENEDDYYGLVTALTAMPIDMMVQLDDIGVDFEKINEWDLFLLLFESLKRRDTSLVFGTLDLSSFSLAINPENKTTVLLDKETGNVIDRLIHEQIAGVLRKIHHLKKDNRKPGNREAKRYIMDLERKKIQRHNRSKREISSQLEEYIIALVNTEQFPYKFDEVLDLTIYQFNESLRQVIKKIDYDNRMHGVYSGTVRAKDLSQDDLNWMTHK